MKLGQGVGYSYYFRIEEMRAINFYSLIEMYVFYAFKERGIKTNKILSAHTTLVKLFNTPYPFAKENLYTDGGSILLGDKVPSITADENLQFLISEFLDPYCDKITFDHEIGLASKYYPLGKDKSVVISPDHQFGSPTLENTNIIPKIIYDLYIAGESISFISDLYNIKEGMVEDAIEYLKAA